MKQKITTILVIWVFSLLGMILTAESLNCTFVLAFVAFAISSYALRYNSNIVSHEE